MFRLHVGPPGQTACHGQTIWKRRRSQMRPKSMNVTRKGVEHRPVQLRRELRKRMSSHHRTYLLDMANVHTCPSG